MAQKTVDLPGIGSVILAKRRGTRNLRLSVKPNGQVRVGMPAWAPYSAGIKFALQRSDWIISHLGKTRPIVLKEGQRIGKSYRLGFVSVSRPPKTSTRLGQNSITVTSYLPFDDPDVQSKAARACERALKTEAQKLLKQRLDQIAKAKDFTYKELRIKRLTSRWGSCSNDGRITLSYFLTQLPWHLIDYVIVHELIHTRHLNHSRDFWELFEKVLPGAKYLRKEIKLYDPVLLPD